MDLPGTMGDSNPAGQSFLDQSPGPRPEDLHVVRPSSALAGTARSKGVPSGADTSGAVPEEAGLPGTVLWEAALAALIDSDPMAGEPLPEPSDAEWAVRSAAADDADALPCDEDIALLLSSMPADDRTEAGCPPAGNHARGPAAAGTAADGLHVFPFPMPDAPWADPGQCDPAVSLFPGPMDLGRVRVIRAAVPDLGEAPRPDNPQGVEWSPVAGADALAGLDPNNLGENDLLDYVHAANRLAAFARAMEYAALAVFAARRPPLASEAPATPEQAFRDVTYRSRYAAAEIMAVHCVGVGAARCRLDDAETLAHNLPGTSALYRAGLLDSIRIKAILAGLENVPAKVQSVIEPLFLPGASRSNPRALTRKIRNLAQKHNPEPLAVRHERAKADRRVWFTPLPDGMAQISAVLDAVPAKALYDSLDSWARQAQRDGAEPGGGPSTGTTPTGRPSRSLNNYLADSFLDLLHQAFLHPAAYCVGCGGSVREAGAGSSNPGHPVPEAWFGGRIPAKIGVVVPALTLLHKLEEPGHLEGYGPIPPGQARELAAGAYWWERLLTDPVTNARLSVGRQRYHPPADIASEVRRRDPVCTGIGCDHPASTCELDHTVPFRRERHGPGGILLAKGDTSVENLRPRDLYCHRLKDVPDTNWSVEPDGPGRTRTTTPTGRIYIHTQNEDPCPF